LGGIHKQSGEKTKRRTKNVRFFICQTYFSFLLTTFVLFKRVCMKGFVFFVTIIFIASFSNAQITFAPYQATATGSWPEVVAIGDVNNDGLNDVVLATASYSNPANDYKLFVFLQDVSGNLQSPIKYPYSNGGPGVSSISIADLNNDSRNDVVIGFGDSIGVFFQNTLSTLNSVKGFYSGSQVTGLNTGDLNNDGLQDVVVFHNNNFIRVFYQNISGFTPNNYPAPIGGQKYFSAINTGDVNSDGLNDVVYTTNQPSNGLHDFIQNASGSLNNYITYSVASAPFVNYGSSAIGDLNNDGKNDVAVAGYANSPNSEVVLWFQDPITTTFGTPLQIPAYDCPEPIAIADLNCDGKNEIILVHGGWNKTTVFEQNSLGQYGSYNGFALPYASHYPSHALAVGDFNNDGKKDIAIADYNNGLVTLLNTSSTPTVTITASGNASICVGSPITLNASGSSNYIWSPATGLSSTTGSNVVATPTATTTYTVTSANGCGNINNSITVVVHPLPVISLSQNNTICSGNADTLTAGGGTIYSWSNGNTNPIIIVSPTSNTTYSLSVSNGYCSSDSSVTIMVNPSPVAAISGGTNLCSGQNTTLTASGGGNYLWNTGVTNNTISVSPSTTTNYSVTVTSVNGCSDTANANIVVTPMPIATINPNSTVCAGSVVMLTASGGINYSWSIGAITSSIQVTPNTSTNYSVVVANGNCTDTASTSVTVNPNPTATTSGSITIFQGHSTTLSANGGGNYVWSNGETTTAISVTPAITTVYCVTVTDTNNCKDNACATVTIESPCDTAGQFFFPNAFSPNRDGENDLLKIYYNEMSCIATLHLIIYDRWGEMVFETDDKFFQWDGNYLNQTLTTQVLAFQLSVGFTGGNMMNRKGNISLMK